MASTARQRTRKAQGKPESNGYPVFKVKVDGDEIVVDQNTFTWNERMMAKRALSAIGYTPDNEDRAVAAVWVTLRRTDPDLTFSDFAEQITVGTFLAAETVDASEDDSPEV